MRNSAKQIWIALTGMLLAAASWSAPVTIINTCLMPNSPLATHSLAENAIAKQLGWVQTNDNRCNGYYLEPPFIYPQKLVKTNAIQISSDQPFLFSQHGTSTFQGQVTVTRYGQQITASKAYLYRNSASGKINAIDLIGNVHLREPNSLIIAQQGHFDKSTHAQSLQDILYRTSIYNNFSFMTQLPTNAELQVERKILQLSAWGQAKSFSQNQPKIFEFEDASYTTCPPLSNTWRVKAKHIVLNKITGRGSATHARLYIKGIPVLYSPYLSFPIDHRRQTGFLAPSMGKLNGDSAFGMPFYWNIAPNYDMTITPLYIKNRGLQLSDLFRYLTPHSQGQARLSVLPNDRQFATFKQTAENTYGASPDASTQSSLRCLQDASTTRGSFSWQDTTRHNMHWASNIDYNYVSDSNYLKDFKTNLNQITTNQLLQQAEGTYQDLYWNLTARIQGYQTLHPVGDIQYKNQYGRFPQIILNGNFPDEKTGIEYTVNNEFDHFDIRDDPISLLNNPTNPKKFPMGNRLNIQPGIAYPFNWPAFYFTPRVQFAATKYDVGHVENGDPKLPGRGLPIFDINSGLSFDRTINWLGKCLRQTFEPQIYYTYVPYEDQSNIPLFDTTLNTLTYDQLFIYNRFSGLDRIGDANQISLGIATRLIDQASGYEKVKAGLGQIYYFRDRRVSLCYGPDCPNQTEDPDNRRNRSPLSGTLTYRLNSAWNIKSDTIWNPFTRKVDNQNLALRYQPDEKRVINLGYMYVRNGDVFGLTDNENGLQQTDLSVGWPVNRDWSTVARWSQDWKQGHFQSLLYGLQYDSCCWAVRFIAGRTYVGISTNKTYQYNNEYFLQFSLKGLGNIGPGSDPSQLLNNSISGYQNNFGRDF